MRDSTPPQVQVLLLKVRFMIYEKSGSLIGFRGTERKTTILKDGILKT